MIDVPGTNSKRELKSAGRLAVLFLAVLAVFFSGCSSVKTPPDTVNANFFENPNRVWAAIEISLDTLDYEVESSNRPDGKMRAVPGGDSDGMPVALQIDQVAWTQDQVRVYVKPVALDTSSPVGQEALDKVAADFLTVLKRKLGS